MTMPQYQRQGYGRFLIDFSKYSFVMFARNCVLTNETCRLLVVEGGGPTRNTGETIIGLGARILSCVLEVGIAGIPTQSQGYDGSEIDFHQ